MNKVTIVTTEKDAAFAVGQMRKAGVLHVVHGQVPHADQITALEHKLRHFDEVVGIMKPLAEQIPLNDKDDFLSVEKKVLSLAKERQNIYQEFKKYEEKLNWFKEWFDIDQTVVEELASKGITLKLYLSSKKEFEALASDENVYIVRSTGKQVVIAFISLTDNDGLGFQEIKIPQQAKHYVEKHIQHLNCCLRAVDEKIEKLSLYRESFLRQKEILDKRLAFAKVRYGMAHKENLCWLQGFVPVETKPEIENLANKHGWALISQEPGNVEEVPTLVRTPAWISIIKPVFNFMGTLPGYKEFDISFWFLLFFSIFFAMLIGDAGYGLLFAAVTAIIQIKNKNIPANLFALLYVLSAATIIWGAVSGTWFGSEQIARIPLLNSLIVERVNSFVEVNQQFMMYVSFVIGIIHLTIAHAIVVARYSNSLLALSQAGWIGILWSLFFVTGKVVLDKPLPDFLPVLAVISISLVLFFSSSHKNIIVRVGLSLANLPLKVINSFADILSYLRLFVIGYVSVMVASSFNEMALEIGFGNFFSGLAAAAILFFGHSLNIVLGLLSVLVHGIRLNMLEFSGHLNMEWAGVEYKPFRQ